MQIGQADLRHARAGGTRLGARRGPLVGLLLLVGLAAVAFGAAAAAIFGPPAPPPGLNASASVEQVTQYLADSTGVTRTFAVHNTGSVSIGAVEISRPTGWAVTACPDSPAGWTAKRSGKFCRYQSADGTGDDIPAGATWSDFQVRATTDTFTTNRVGTWRITVSKSNKFDGPSRFRPAAPEGPGLGSTAWAFQVTDAAVGDASIGTACPAATPANHAADAGSAQTIIVCGRNRSSAAATPVAGESSLAGSFLSGAASGFTSGSIPAASGTVVLARWSATIAGSGTSLDLTTKIGSASNKNSPLTTLADACGSPAAGTDCVDNGGYSTTAPNTDPVANDDGGAGFSTDEDSSFTTGNVLANDTDGDGDTLAVQSIDTTGTAGLVTDNGDGTFAYDPNGQFESLNTGDSDTDTFTYTVSDGNGGTDTATVTIAISGVTDSPGDVAPTVTSTTPANGAVDVALGASIDVTFSEPVAASGSSFSLECPTATPVAFAVTGSPGTTITIDPTGDLPAGTACVVTVLAAGISDSDADDPPDTMTSNVVFGFTTASPGDAAPTVTSTTPINGATGVALDADIDVTFSESVAASGSSFTLECPAALAVAFTVSGSPGTSIQIDPSPELPANTVCVVTVLAAGITDTDATDPPDTMISNVAFSFTTASGPDVPPTAVDDSASVGEDADAGAIDVLTNDTDTDGGPKTISSASDPANGTVVLTGGSPGAATGLTYEPDPNFCNNPPGTTPDTFTYTLNGGSTGTVSVTVTCVDDAPTAVDDSATVAEDSGAGAIDVLFNDTDIDGGPKTIASASDPANGTVVLTGGSPGAHTGLTYQPDASYCNVVPDTFTYTLNGSSTATVSVTVTCAGDIPPTAVDDSATVLEDADAGAIDVLSNDPNADGGPKTISSASDPANGTVVLTGGSAGAHTGLTYEPDPNSCNDPPGVTPDTFTYTLNGGSTATVSVTVTCVDDAPTVVTSVGMTLWTEGDLPVVIDPTVAVSDVDSGNLQGATIDFSAGFQSGDDELNFFNTPSITGIFVAGTGVLTLTGSATVAEYQAALRSIVFATSHDDPSDKTIRFVVTDGTSDSAPATKVIDVTGVNDAPDAVADSGTGFSTDEDSSFSTASVLTNDTDPEGQTLAVQSVDTTGMIGLLTNNGDGTFFYNPNGQFEALNDGQTATDVFTYTITDGNGGGDNTTVTILITGDTDGVNQLPVANDDSGTGFGTNEDTSFTTGNALANDTDGDGDTLTVQSIDTTGTAGLVTDNNDGTFGYDPNGQFESLNTGDSDTDTFTYTISDGNGGTDTATVTIAISGVTEPVNQPPVAVDDGGQFFTTNEDTTNFHMGSVVDNDSDPDNDAFTVTGFDAITTEGGAITSGGTDGTFFYDANGLFEDLQVGESTTDTFTYTIDDGNGGTDTATVTITIGGVNDAPDAVDDGGTGYGTSESAGFDTASVLENDTDVEGDTLTVSGHDATSTKGGVIANNFDGTFDYDPNGQFEGLAEGETTTDTFGYTISDGNGGTDTATVTITITGVNDDPDAVDDTGSTDEDNPTTVSVLGNDTDQDVTDVLLVTLVGTADNGGSASIVNAGTQVQFDPADDFHDLAAGATRQSAFTYTISDGNGGTDTATVTVTVTGINDAPVADDELISGTDAAVGNTTLIVNDPTDAAPTGPGGPKKSIAGDILDGDTDVDGPNAPVVQAGTFATNGGGSVTIEADGDFVFTPAVGTSCSAVSDFFDYTITDGAVAPLTDVGRVTISLSNCVWYVRNNAGAGGDGRSATPFNTLAAAEAPSLAGHWIYVHAGDGTTTGLGAGGAGAQFVLDNDQTFIGEAVALVVNGATLNAAGARPNIGLGLALQSNDTVTGVSLASNAVAGILAGGGDLHGTIADVIITSNFGGITMQGSGGIWTITSVSVTSSLLDAIQLSSAGQVTFTPTGTISVTATGGRAIAFSGATTTLAGTIDSVTANTSATTGIFIDDTIGSLTIGDVNLITSGTAIDIDSANDITITNSGDASVSSSGIAIEVTTDGANPANGVDITLEDVGSTGGVSGIRLIDIGNGTFSASGGTLANHTVAAIDIDFGSGNVTYPGTISNGTGLSVDITNRSGGTVTLNGSITDTNDAGGGINLDNNDNSTVTFGGNLTLNTGASAAFVATNGGTVNAAGTASTVTTTTGTGVNISGTNIGGSNVTFDTVNVDGDDVNPTNGVVVSGTGSSGSFSITGTGTAGTGGTIRDTSGDGIRLVGTLAPSLNQMTVTSNLGNGIQGGDGTVGGLVTGATLQNLVVSANGTDTGAEDGIKFQGLVGTATFSGLNVSGSARNNVSVINNTGTLTSLTISGSSIHDNHATLGSSGLVLIGDGSASMTATVGTTTFATNRVNGILAQTNGASNLTVTVNGGTYTNHFVAVEFTHASTGSLTGTLTGATITNAINGCSGTASPCGVPVNLFMGTNAGSDAGSVLRATITNNTINNGGSANAPGIWMHTGTPTRGHARLLITGNTITNVNQNGIEVAGGGCIVAGTICDATIDATIEGNSVTLGAAGADAVHFNIGTAGTAVGNHDTLVVCGDIENNTLSSGGADAIRLRHRSTTTIRLVGYAGSAFDTAAVIAYLDGRNPAVTDTFSAATSSAGGGFLNTSPAGTNCLQP